MALAGAITGDNIGFWIGHKSGDRLARRYGPKIRLDERKLKIARYLFDTHGPKVVFFGRFISLLRLVIGSGRHHGSAGPCEHLGAEPHSSVAGAMRRVIQQGDRGARRTAIHTAWVGRQSQDHRPMRFAA